jgi:creatinine amidohydrolase
MSRTSRNASGRVDTEEVTGSNPVSPTTKAPGRRPGASSSFGRHCGLHAGELETSLLLHIARELVRPGQELADCIADERPHLLVSGMAAYTRTGVIRRPSLATAGKGRALLESLVKSFSAHLTALTT